MDLSRIGLESPDCQPDILPLNHKPYAFYNQKISRFLKSNASIVKRKMESNCIFCKIGKGEIPTNKVLETDNFIVIKDLHPKTKGHSIVFPKNHYKTLLDMPSTLLCEFMHTVKKVALLLMQENKAEGFNLVMNNFESAGQVIHHAHMHILPRYNKGNDGYKSGV